MQWMNEEQSESGQWKVQVHVHTGRNYRFSENLLQKFTAKTQISAADWHVDYRPIAIQLIYDFSVLNSLNHKLFSLAAKLVEEECSLIPGFDRSSIVTYCATDKQFTIASY